MTSPKWLLVSHAYPTQIKGIFLRTEGLKRTQVFEREVVVNVTKEFVNKSQKTVWMSLMTPVWETSKDNESVKVKLLSRVRLSATPWTAAHQAPPSTGFSRQEYWSGVPLPSPGDLSSPGIKPRSPALQADSLSSEPPGKPNITNRSQNYQSHCILPC